VSLWGKIFGINKNPEYELGIKLYNEGKYELAVAELEKAIPKAGKADPFYALGMFYAAESHAHIGTAKYLAGDPNEALVHFQKAVQENPTYPDVFYRMGVINHRLGKLDESVSNLRSAIELNPSYFEATCYLGIVLHERGEKDEADGRVQARARDRSGRPQSDQQVPERAPRRLRDVHSPLAALKQMMRSDTEFDDAVNEGIEAYNTGNSIPPCGRFTAALAIHPDYADLRFKLALAFLRSGDHDDAKRSSQRRSRSIRATWRRIFTSASRTSTSGSIARPIAHFEKPASIKPDYADLQCYARGDLFLSRRARPGAEPRSRNRSPSRRIYAKARFYYGLLLYALGDRKRAIEYLSDATQARGAQERRRSQLRPRASARR